MGTEKKSETSKLSASFKVGAIAFAFLIIGYQVALFVHSAAVARLESHRDAPDTVFVISSIPEGQELITDGAAGGAAGKRAGQSRADGSRASDRRDGTGAMDAAGRITERVDVESRGTTRGGAVGRNSERGDGAGRITERVDVESRGTKRGGAVGRNSERGDGAGRITERGDVESRGTKRGDAVGRNSERGDVEGRTTATISDGSNGRQRVTSGNIYIERRNASHSARAEAILDKAVPRRIESFPFDPNTASIQELKRLGFSEKQAVAIDNYRSKGGRFRRPEDFAKSYVVADSVFKRLRPFIRIPKTDLNAADSAAFDALPGIGPYFASKMLSYRQLLGGYSYPEQLMDIYNFGEDRYIALSGLIEVGASAPFPLWTASEEELSHHPYIGQYAARGIVLFRENNPAASWSVEALREAGILSSEDASRLSRCRIAAPQ